MIKDARAVLSGIPDNWLLAVLAFAAYLIGAAVTTTRVPQSLDRLMNYSEDDHGKYPFREIVIRALGRGTTIYDTPDWTGRTWDKLESGVKAILYAHWMTLPPLAQRIIGAVVRKSPQWVKTPAARVLNSAFNAMRFQPERGYRRLFSLLSPPLTLRAWTMHSILEARINAACDGDESSARRILDGGTPLSSHATTMAGSFLGHAHMEHYWDDPPTMEHNFRDTLIRGVIEGLEQDFRSIVNRVRTSSEELYNDYDRASAESDMRLGVSMPLSAIAIALAVTYTTPWPLLGLLFTVTLFVRGWQKRYEADAVIWDALIYESVPIREWDGLRSMENLPPPVPLDEAWADVRATRHEVDESNRRFREEYHR